MRADHQRMQCHCKFWKFSWSTSLLLWRSTEFVLLRASSTWHFLHKWQKMQEPYRTSWLSLPLKSIRCFAILIASADGSLWAAAIKTYSKISESIWISKGAELPGEWWYSRRILEITPKQGDSHVIATYYHQGCNLGLGLCGTKHFSQKSNVTTRKTLTYMPRVSLAQWTKIIEADPATTAKLLCLRTFCLEKNACHLTIRHCITIWQIDALLGQAQQSSGDLCWLVIALGLTKLVGTDKRDKRKKWIQLI